MNVDNLLKAINLAHYDGVKNLNVSIGDLHALRAKILYLQETNKDLTKALHMAKGEVERTSGKLLELMEREELPRLDKYV